MTETITMIRNKPMGHNYRKTLLIYNTIDVSNLFTQGDFLS